MAKKKVREYHGKKLIKAHAGEASAGKVKFDQLNCVLVDSKTDWNQLRSTEGKWLTEGKLVAKPDMMFGQRGKLNLVLLNASIDEAEKYVKERLGKEIEIKGVKGVITHFIIEPFVPHKEEYYLSIYAERLNTVVLFSTEGGVDVEDAIHAGKVYELVVPVGLTLRSSELKSQVDQMFANVAPHLLKPTENYVATMFDLFESLDMVVLETNPFCFIDCDGEIHAFPLDLVMELDDTARFKNTKKWGNDLVFPEVFGRRACEEEKFVEELDEKTGASLKLTVLNPKGRIWNLVAGGGASVVFADTVVDLGWANELGNYGEYSGAPNEEETYHYAKTVIDLCTRNPDGKGRVLLIGGGIANFTDVSRTFKGIVHALKEYKQKLQDAKVRIYVRRAGPNYKLGLALMRELGKEIGIPIYVFGPEKNMTEIIPMAISYLQESQ